MEKHGLIIGIDYTNEYCQACYYDSRHKRVESITTGGAVMRYLIPTVLCYDKKNEGFLTGETAMLYAEQEGCDLIGNLLDGMLIGEQYEAGGRIYTYAELFARYIADLLDMVKIRSGQMNIENVTMTLRYIDPGVKAAVENALLILKIGPDRVRLVSCDESFAYYVLEREPQLKSTLLFDFGSEGFFSRQLAPSNVKESLIYYVKERDHSADFSVKDVANAKLRLDLDNKLTEIYEEVMPPGVGNSVYFTGEGFSEMWFEGTLRQISRKHKVFKGNDIYVKGACIAGYIRSHKEGRDFPIMCDDRTKAQISICASYRGKTREIELSGAAQNWYDAGAVCDFILDDDKAARLVITSLASGERVLEDFDLSSFPERPPGTTRIEARVQYISSTECEVTFTDKGFGAFFEGSGMQVKKKFDFGEYI